MNDDILYQPLELEETSLPADAKDYKQSLRWLSWPLILFFSALPVMIFIMAPDYLGLCLLAYLNCVICTWAILKFIKIGTLEAFVPVLFLPLMIISWPLGSIYFAMFQPDIHYHVRDALLGHLDGNTRVQAALLTFLLGYLPVIFFALRKSAAVAGGHIRNIKRVAELTAIIAMCILSVNATSKVVALPSAVVYVIDGTLKNTEGLLLIPGALFTYLPKRTRLAMAIFMPSIVFFYTLGNARGLAMVPCTLFLFGILFFSELSPKTKFTLLMTLLVVLPFYIVIGNVTRMLTKTIGFEDLGYRLEALKEWRSVVKQLSILGTTFGRFFFSGGHAIITQTPESYPYLPFDVFAYFKEVIISLIPGRIYSMPFYSSTGILTLYGFMITKATSVEVSLIGNMWLLGGYKFVFMGGIATGLLHYLLIKILRRAWRKSGLKAFLYLGLCANIIFGAAGQDIITIWRNLMWRLVFSFVLYIVVAFLSGEMSQSESSEYQEYLESEASPDYT